MTHPKRRSFQHIMEEDSGIIFSKILPKEWVVRGYKPDYGIDLAVEVFDKVKGKANLFETLGEHFFVQLKSSNNCEYATITVKSRINVELGPLKQYGEEENLEVVKFVLDTSELLTVQTMGPAQVVLLVLVDLSNRRTFFVCLNDYIDKVLLPEDSLFSSQKYKTIYIPVTNELNRSNLSLMPLRFIAKRAKFYAAFEKFHFQNYYLLKDLDFKEIDKDALLTFLYNIKRLDIWRGTDMWEILAINFDHIKQMLNILNRKNVDIKSIYPHPQIVWHNLCALSWAYEEMCREWFLPTSLAIMCSTQNGYTLAKNKSLPMKAGCVSFNHLIKKKTC